MSFVTRSLNSLFIHSRRTVPRIQHSQRTYASKSSVSKEVPINAEEIDQSADPKFIIRPNKLLKNPKTFKKMLSTKGLKIGDVTSPSAPHSFNPNEFYETVDNVLGGSELKKPKNLKHLFKAEEIDQVTRGFENTRGALVDEPEMKAILDQDIEKHNEKELKRPFRPSGNLVFVTLIRSANHQIRLVKKSVHQLGLRKIHQTQVHADSPRVRGFVFSCRHLVHVQIVPVNELFPRGIPKDEMLPEELRLKPRVSMIERATSRSQRRRASPRDYSRVESRYTSLKSESQKILSSIPQA